MSVNKKTCIKCQLDQPLSNFHKSQASKDGLRSDCKSCRKPKSKDHPMYWLTDDQGNKRICIVDGCEKGLPRAWGAKDMCRGHYNRLVKTGELKPELPLRKRRSKGMPPENCTIDDCSTQSQSLGLCVKHYKKQYSKLNPVTWQTDFEGNTKTCTVDGCDKKLPRTGCTKELCQGHYSRLIKTGDLKPELPLRHRQPKSLPPKSCSIEDCLERAKGLGFCVKHYARLKSTGDPEKIKIRERGQGSIHNGGYHWKYYNGKQTMVHRIVMQEHLGRELTAEENVHHINGDRLDNRLENLELWEVSQPPGQRVVDKVAWAKELLALYEPEALVKGRLHIA